MKVLIVYESMYGNTRAIAEAVTDGVRSGLEAVLRPVAAVTADDLAEAGLVIVGAPTHMHSMPRPMTRKAAVKAALSNDALRSEPGAAGPGIREWLRTIGDGAGKRAAVFDTRVTGNVRLTGRASLRIARRVREAGFEPAAAPASFQVDKQNRLLDGELDRARAWGKGLAARFGVEQEPVD